MISVCTSIFPPICWPEQDADHLNYSRKRFIRFAYLSPGLNAAKLFSKDEARRIAVGEKQ
jgi:hypothetical protein